jgi:hypothetical protein
LGFRLALPGANFSLGFSIWKYQVYAMYVLHELVLKGKRKEVDM